MFRRIAPVALVAAALSVLAFSHTPSASAHDRRNVAGTYNFVVGFITEPALVEEPNGIDLRITDAANAPVLGAEKTLKAEMSFGDQKKTVELRARFGQPGAYTADLIPTKAGTWVFRFFGAINDTPVDERFESGPGRFNDVQSKTTMQFPVALPSISELANQGTPAEHNHAESGAMAAMSLDTQRALDQAESARTLALIFGSLGLLVGAVGAGLAVLALRSSARSPR